MELKEQVTKWVEKKIRDIVNRDLEEEVIDENSHFDVEAYVNILMEKHFTDNSIEQLKEIFNQDSFDDLFYSNFEYYLEERSSLHDSLDFDSNECHLFEGEIIKNLENTSREVKKKTLRALEASIEDFINQASWNVIINRLQKILKRTGDQEMCNLVLKVFQKLLRCPKKPQAICKGFTTITSVVAKQIALFNLESDTTLEQIYGSKKGKGHSKDNLEAENPKHRTPIHGSASAELLIKLMWLLVDCQQQMPKKLTRLNESRFREIIFSFVHLLSATTVSENKRLSGLELLSILNPTATWCRYYCHTATGRSLLSSALKKYKTFFVHVVEAILNHIKIKKSNRLPPIGDSLSFNRSTQKFKNDTAEVLKPLNKVLSPGREREKHENRLKSKHLDERNSCIRSAPVEQTGATASEDGRTKRTKNNSEWIVKGISRRVVNEAVFCHSVSFVTRLIQFQHGRALFPLHISTRQRPLNVQDFSLYLTEYLESGEFDDNRAGINFTSNYKAKLLEIVRILKNVKDNMNSSRSTERQPFS